MIYSPYERAQNAIHHVQIPVNIIVSFHLFPYLL